MSRASRNGEDYELACTLREEADQLPDEPQFHTVRRLMRQASTALARSESTPNIEDCTVPLPDDLHPDTKDLVLRFAHALAIKLRKAERKYGYDNGWKEPGWMDECRAKLREHLEKGDPRDVAAYCAFLWWHQESTKSAAQQQHASAPKAEWLIWSNEHRGWWGPDSSGYFHHPDQAGRYTLERAKTLCKSRSWDDRVPPETMMHIDAVIYGLPQRDERDGG